MTTTKERWHNFVRPYLHRLMEWVRNDPEVTYEDWKKIKQNYKDTMGKEYERPQK